MAKAVGKSRPAIANTLRLLNLPEPIQQLVANGQLTMGHARALLSLERPEEQIYISEKIITEKLSVRETEEIVRQTRLSGVSRETPGEEEEKKQKERQKIDPNLQAIIDDMTRLFGTKVRIKKNGERGKIEIEYYSPEEFERITEILLSL